MEEELDAEEIADQALIAHKNEVRVEQNQVREETNTSRNNRNENQIPVRVNIVRSSRNENQTQERANTSRNSRHENPTQERAMTDRTIVDQSRAQKEQNSSKTREVEKQAQVRPNIKGNNVQKNGRDNIPSPLRNKEDANTGSNHVQQKGSDRHLNRQKSKIDKQTVNNETQKKSQTLEKGEGKKVQGKNKELQNSQPWQSQTGPREVRQPKSQPTKAPEPLPGGSHELDESVSKREKLEGQVREGECQTQNVFRRKHRMH